MELTIDMSVPETALVWFAILAIVVGVLLATVVTGAACLIAGV